MTINRRTKFRPGSLDASIVKDNTGLLIEEDTGKLSAQPLVDEDLILHQRINDLYWKDPLEVFDDITAPEDYRVGDTFYVKEAQQIYIYGGVQTNVPEGVDVYQPQSWIDANREEVFFPIAVGLDKDSLATKAYVNREILNLIDSAPQLLDTLNELAAAINDNPNFANDILNITTSLQNSKADKDSVYTKTEVDNKDDAIIDFVNTLNAQARRVPDYVVGAGPYADDDNLQELLNSLDLTDLTEYKTIYLRKGTITPVVTTLTDPSLIITSFDKNIVKLNQLVIDTGNASLTEPNFISLSNLSSTKLTIPDTTQTIEVFITGCHFDRIDILSSNAIVHIEDSSINRLIVNDSTLNIKNSTLDSIDNITLLNATGESLVKIFTSKIKGQLFVSNESKLYLNKNELQNIGNNPYLVSNDLDSFISLENSTFYSDNTFVAYTAAGGGNYHVDGLGQLYANLNNYDRRLNPALDSDSSYTTKITVQPLLNNESGLPVQNYYLPVGYENFFYNDERARDTIAEMLQVEPGIVKNYDDINDTLTLSLNISTANLNDQASIAYKDRVNSFIKANTFAATLTANAGVYTNLITAASGTITNLTTVTQPLTDNSTKVATTAFVQGKYDELEFDLLDLELGELKDVDLNSPQSKHYLTYIPINGATLDHWTNESIDSFDLTDSGTLVRVGDSVFVLADIARPSLINQSGNTTSGWPSTSQVLRWSGEQYDLSGTLTKGPGQWSVDLANNPILRATQEPEGSAYYDGWGKIALADWEEVRDGSNSTKAVVPSLLHTYYASVTLSNLNSTQVGLARENIGFPKNPQDSTYLIYSADDNAWVTAKTARPSYLHASADVDQTIYPGLFYSSASASNLMTLTLPDDSSGDIFFRKADDDTKTVRFVVKNNSFPIITSDNVILTTFDVTSQGQTIEFSKVEIEGSPYWLAKGYYQSSTTGAIDKEFIQDAAAELFTQNSHAPAISLIYQDPDHRIDLALNYATNAQVLAGVVNNLPVTPAGLKAALDANVPQGVLFSDNNLSDVGNVIAARTNLGLGSVSTYNIGSTTSTVLPNAQNLQANKVVGFNGTGLVSATTSAFTATTLSQGLVTLAKASDANTSNNSVTASYLNTVLSDPTHWLTLLLNQVVEGSGGGGAGALTYTPMTETLFTADFLKYYSLSTSLASMVITLPPITPQNLGNRIEFKLALNTAPRKVTILVSGLDTIDHVYTEIELVEQGQHIALIPGISNNWEIA